MRRTKLIVVLLAALLFSTNQFAQQTLPINLPDHMVPPLRSIVDEHMQSHLESAMRANAKWSALIDDEKLAVGLVDLTDPYNARFARVNGNHMMYAASLPKIAVLLAVMDAIEQCEVEKTATVVSDLNSMIRYSSNQAASRMIDLVGFDKIEEVLTDPRYEFFDEEFGGGLWVGKNYGSAGKRHPDPIQGLSHAATVSQVCRFYYLMAMGKLVSFERSQEMLKIMERPGLSHKFVNTIARVAPGAKVYRKSGSWRTYHSDSVLVWGSDTKRRYILVALTDSEDGEQIMRKLVTVAENVLRLTK